MSSLIDERYLKTRVALMRNVADMAKACEARTDLSVTTDKSENAPIVITLNLPSTSLHGLVVWSATHTQGDWWKTSSDVRFFQ
jgi:hypothetical protein